MAQPSLLRLIGLVFMAVSFIVVGDTAGKLLTSGGVAPFIVAWTRFGIAALCMLPFSGLTRSELPQLLHWRVALRATVIAASICCMLTALRSEPIANVFGAFFVGPIVSYVLAILFLKERPSLLRSLLLMVGFAGVMLVVKPGFGVSTGMIFALVGGFFHGGYLVMTRTVAPHYRPRFLLISQLMIGTVIITPMGLSSPWPELSIPIAGLILLSAFASAIGNYTLVIANRKAEASLIAPLVYTQLVSATVAGVIVFGDWPDVYTFLGLGLIALSGAGSLLANQYSAKAKAQKKNPA